MAINPKTTGIHHIGLRCTDMEISKKFYRDILGFTLALDTPELIGFLAGPAIIAFKKANAQHGEEVFTPFNIGLDHVALACESAAELNRVARALSDAELKIQALKLMKLHKNNMSHSKILTGSNGSSI
jgi:glyoxylase I family protein